MQEFEVLEDMARHLMLAVQIRRLTKNCVKTAWAPSAAKMAAVPKKKNIVKNIVKFPSNRPQIEVLEEIMLKIRQVLVLAF